MYGSLFAIAFPSLPDNRRTTFRLAFARLRVRVKAIPVKTESANGFQLFETYLFFFF
jgi:hypothetical protein